MTLVPDLLTTKRLTLRLLTHEDAPFLLRLLNEPGWLEHIGDRAVQDLAAARRYVDEGPRRSYREHGYGLLRLARIEDDIPIGICGLVRRDSLPGPDLGVALLGDHEGQGFAEEAARAVIRDAEERLGRTTLLAVTAPANARSRRLLARLGFTVIEERSDTVLLRRDGHAPRGA